MDRSFVGVVFHQESDCNHVARGGWPHNFLIVKTTGFPSNPVRAATS
jgi:hypothetical protein